MIAIKEMKMPNSCSECNLTTRKTWNYACSINLKDIDCTETKRPKDCSLVEIEERKVGKWIDKEKINKAIEEIQKLRGCSCSCSDGIIDDVEDILDKLIETE